MVTFCNSNIRGINEALAVSVLTGFCPDLTVQVSKRHKSQ